MRDTIVGIDLGTTNSLVAWCDESGPRVLSDADGRRMLPSAVRFVPGQGPVVGHVARKEAHMHRADTVLGAKRLMGRGHAEARLSAPEQARLRLLTPPPMCTSAALLRWHRSTCSPVPAASSRYAEGPSASARVLEALLLPAQRPASPLM